MVLLVFGDIFTDISPQNIHGAFLVAVENGLDKSQFSGIWQGFIFDQNSDLAQGTENFGIYDVQHSFKSCALGLSLHEYRVFVIPGRCRLKRLHHVEQQVDQSILQPMVSSGNEGDGMQVPISGRAALQLEHFRFLDTTSIIVDAFGSDVDTLKNGCDLSVQV